MLSWAYSHRRLFVKMFTLKPASLRAFFMKSTERFSDRVEDYVKYRPHYPIAVIACLAEVYGFASSWVVADIGSGTGISTGSFLEHGNKVYAVEPNADMRDKAEELLHGYGERFVSVDGTAEATGLAEASVELLVAGQAFHWFDPVRSRVEFMRVLKPGGVVALIWNERLMQSSFEKEYEALILHYASDYKTINHKHIADLQIADFFAPADFRLDQFANEQLFDYVGLKGRLLSSSYIPKEGPGFSAMMEDLERLFEKHQSGGRVRVGYDTKLYSGVLKPSYATG
jgi:SAM-dependent methyltransferase